MSEFPIEIDPRHEVVSLDYEASDTTSLASDVKNYVFEHGRRYHGWHEGQYAMPNDEEEQDRMELQHHICLLALQGKLYKAPALKKPQRILDIGTGNGTWAIECGDLYPEAQVTGTDLSPIQPRWVPQNVTFEVDDMEQIWTYEDNYFDMIHLRQLCGFINDWPKLYKQALRVLKPGGTIEIQDCLDFECDDGTLPEDSYMYRWAKLWRAGMAKVGKEVPLKSHAAKLTKAGFENAKYDPTKIPIGTWPVDKEQKELGFYTLQHLIDGIEGISLAVFTRFLGWSREDMDTFLCEVRRELKNRKYHAHTHLHITYAKKPL